MALLTREALLGASDLVEREVELPSIGGHVRVRSLPAAYANQAQSEALEMVTDRRGGQTAHVNTGKLEALQVLHGLIEPKFDSIDEVYTFAQRCGPAWRRIVEVIDEISGIDKDAIERVNATFQPGAESEGGGAVGAADGTRNGRSDLPVRVGVGTEDAGR